MLRNLQTSDRQLGGSFDLGMSALMHFDWINFEMPHINTTGPLFDGFSASIANFCISHKYEYQLVPEVCEGHVYATASFRALKYAVMAYS